MATDSLKSGYRFDRVNSKGEVIVLKIVSDNPEAERHIKSRINYKKVSHRTSKPGEIYMMPVRVVQA